MRKPSKPGPTKTNLTLEERLDEEVQWIELMGSTTHKIAKRMREVAKAFRNNKPLQLQGGKLVQADTLPIYYYLEIYADLIEAVEVQWQQRIARLLWRTAERVGENLCGLRDFLEELAACLDNGVDPTIVTLEAHSGFDFSNLNKIEMTDSQYKYQKELEFKRGFDAGFNAAFNK